MKKFFILDDNEELLDIMDRILSPQFNVNVSNGRGNAMTKIDEFMPDMIILDYFIGITLPTTLLSNCGAKIRRLRFLLSYFPLRRKSRKWLIDWG